MNAGKEGAGASKNLEKTLMICIDGELGSGRSTNYLAFKKTQKDIEKKRGNSKEVEDLVEGASEYTQDLIKLFSQFDKTSTNSKSPRMKVRFVEYTPDSCEDYPSLIKDFYNSLIDGKSRQMTILLTAAIVSIVVLVMYYLLVQNNIDGRWQMMILILSIFVTLLVNNAFKFIPTASNLWKRLANEIIGKDWCDFDKVANKLGNKLDKTNEIYVVHIDDIDNLSTLDTYLIYKLLISTKPLKRMAIIVSCNLDMLNEKLNQYITKGNNKLCLKLKDMFDYIISLSKVESNHFDIKKKQLALKLNLKNKYESNDCPEDKL